MKKNKEYEMLEYMVKLYSRKKLKQKELGAECIELLEYAKFRREKCFHGENKPYCSCCTIRCYKRDMKEFMAKVMRFSGPRMIFRHPILAFDHLFKTIAFKKQQKKLKKQQSYNKK